MRRSIHTLHPIESFGNAPAKQGEIRVERIENRLQPRVPFPHRHDFYHFIFLEKGSGWHEIDFVRFPVKAKQLFLMRPAQVHGWNLSASTRGFVLEFTKDSLAKSKKMEELFEALESAPTMVLSAENEEVAALLKLMHEEFTKKRADYRLCLEQYLAALLLQLSRLKSDNNPRSTKSGKVDEFKHLIEQFYKEHHKVETYAEMLGLTAKSLTTQTSRALGKSAGTLIQERCLVEAKRLLAYSDMPVADIAYELGFEDPNYFARFFRQRTNFAPGKFRKLANHSVPA